ncbi:variable surface protein [Plasmodium gonderi]|uniref:Variable surface protein n=1 Tax=Plasmodium gonderi TaxID=77519 RepID=A0A1Y1JPG6_PLAGO|nr:variable surface protein [Plasmodium gonderi]GAW84140.1 variable surface protein [Plasmodium gonderi]
MTIPTHDDILKVDFDDVYMRSNENYNSIISRNWNEYKHHNFTDLCSYAKYDICRNSKGVSFTADCRKLVILLDNMSHILNGNHHNKIYFCIYLNYKLHELVKNYNCIVRNPIDVYRYMTEARRTWFSRTIPKTCVGYLVDLGDETFLNFRKLDQLYDNFYKFKYNKHSCSYAEYCSREYKNLLRTSSNEQNMDFHDLLYEFIYHFEKYMIGVESCKDFSQWGQPQSKTNRSAEGSTNTSAMKVTREMGGIKEIERVIEMDGTGKNILKIISERKKTLDKARLSPHTGTETTVSSGMAVLFFSVLIIVFIMYKYTAFGSYFNPRMRKLKRKMKKKDKKNMNIMGSHEWIYNNENGNKYQIQYSYMDNSS